MALSPELQEEVNLLLQFDLSTTLAGLKVHSKADASAVEAAARLYRKGLVDHVDGGYLTALGREVAEHLQAARRILQANPQ
ncbi:TIGR02647 family protein [Simiduia sp. 21SJ11W-1]|uniref:TIGR02647 family protein n=1 Tax=Simiduia sp. 21SJ11W-1 TaxID=2909669 RepID=UPI0020A07ADF|nr:TIGR02647 family protein [Simiduia sp. 21SJ11W-1]UTA47053.1 TIGR02647 family protein [Simiduia sp. 21SJ11W-1]